MVCFAAVYVKTAVMPRTFLDLSDYTMDENSVIYYQDKNTGALVELQTLIGKENAELIEYKDIPEDLINAFVAIEDKRFWNHQGVDWRRTGSGLLRMFTGGNIQGGSTITQQLIKNVTEYDDVTVTRKILEIFTALELENNYSKEDILTLYMNQIWMGNGCRGVQAAAKYYFGKNVWELDLAECASLAGITNNPSLYAPYGAVDVVRYQCQNPECRLYSLTRDEVCEYCGAEDSYDSGSVWTNREFNKARQENILKEMAKEDPARPAPYITEAERDAAIAEKLAFGRDRQTASDDPDAAQDNKPSTVYSWYVEQVINEAIEKLKETTTLSEDMCRKRVFSGGLSIVCAYDPEVQAADTVFNNRENLDQVSSKTGQRLISAISVVDNSTGLVVAMGSTEEKTADRGWNTPVATKRQPGSSIKPLSVYSPAIEMGLITATVVDDSPQELNGKPWPVNVTPTYGGLTTVLHGVTQSLNTVAVRVLEQVTPQASYDFMVNRYGITSMVPYFENSNGQVSSDIDRSPLAMGGLTKGVSTFEMAAAFATFPRAGDQGRRRQGGCGQQARAHVAHQIHHRLLYQLHAVQRRQLGHRHGGTPLRPDRGGQDGHHQRCVQLLVLRLHLLLHRSGVDGLPLQREDQQQLRQSLGDHVAEGDGHTPRGQGERPLPRPRGAGDLRHLQGLRQAGGEQLRQRLPGEPGAVLPPAPGGRPRRELRVPRPRADLHGKPHPEGGRHPQRVLPRAGALLPGGDGENHLLRGLPAGGGGALGVRGGHQRPAEHLPEMGGRGGGGVALRRPHRGAGGERSPGGSQCLAGAGHVRPAGAHRSLCGSHPAPGHGRADPAPGGPHRGAAR